MQCLINGSRIEFWNEDANEMVMYIDYPTDECIWCFYSDDIITLTEDMEIFKSIKQLMLQQYVFNDDEILRSYKDDNKLVWYSDCYYNPDDEWSRNNVSFLIIIYENPVIKLKCINPLDKIMDRKNRSHVIAFSPLGNGKYTKNVRTGMTLQDDFVVCVYQELLKHNKYLKI